MALQVATRDSASIVVGAVCALANGCAAGWDGRVERFGTLREVLRNGETQGRVAVAEVECRPGAVGLGALAQLVGEVTIVDGVAFPAQADIDGTILSSGTWPGARAAFLAVAAVSRWQSVPIDRAVDLDALEALIAGAAERTGLGRHDTIPFVIDGEFTTLRAHVLVGRCPFAADPERRGEPARFERELARGCLVGFYTTLPSGTLTHHGTRVHVHVVLDGADEPSGHVDSVRVVAGRLRLPD